MSVDILEGCERDERAMERIASAMETIAESLVALYKISEARLEKEFPVKPDAREALITRIPTAEDDLKASQGSTGESLSEWTEPLGSREAKLIREQSGDSSRRPSRFKKS